MAAKKKSTRIQRRRKLDELYVEGVEVRFDGGEARIGPFDDDDPVNSKTVCIWVQPCNPLQREQAIRTASAAKSRAVLKARKDEDSDDFANAEAYLSTLSLEELVDQIVSYERPSLQRKAIRDVMEREEWEDLRDLQELVREWEEAGKPEDDPEWDDLLERDKEYGRQVDQKLDQLAEDLRDSLYLVPKPELEDRARQKRVDLIGTQAFIDAYEEQMLYFSCRDDEDRDELFFVSVQDMKSAPEEVRAGLAKALGAFITESDEAKNSPRVEPGSEESALPDEEETSDSSTQEEQIAS